MKKLYHGLIKASNGIFLVEKWLLLVAVAAVVLVNFINVILRYVAGGGLSFCETLSICLFMFLVVIGANIAVKKDAEIKIDIFTFKKNPRAGAVLHFVVDLIILLTLVICIIGLFKTIGSTMTNPQRVTPLPIYTYHIYIVMTIGFFMITLDRIIVTIRHILQMAGQTVEEEAES